MPKPRNSEQEESSKMTRRGFLRGAAAVAGAAAVGYGVKKSLEDYDWQEEVVDEPISDLAPEISPRPEARPEKESNQERFNGEVALYAQEYKLAFNEIQFYDTDGRLVGTPIQFEDFIVDRTRTNGEVFQYRLTPGPINEAGMVTEGIAGEWSRFMREKVLEEHPGTELASDYLHVTADFMAAYNADREGIREAIDSGQVNQYYELVGHFANQPAYPGSDRSRIEYLQEEVQFADDVPEAVQTELRQLIVGLAGLESKFEPGLTNRRSGATGILQFMPDTWPQYNNNPEEIHNFVAQVDAAGQHLSNVYHRVIHYIGSEQLEKIRSHFADEDSFYKDFLVPATIGGYKAGERRVGEGIRMVLEQIDFTSLSPGKDVFLHIADAMRESDEGVLSSYGPLSRAYVSRVYAQTEVLTENGVAATATR